MTKRAHDSLCRELRLIPHPEGGFYREIFRSAMSVRPEDGRGGRSALTLIYYLLPGGAHSRWHRVTSDETWQHVEGGPLDLFTLSPCLSRLLVTTISALSDGKPPVHVVPAGYWQAARPSGDFTLVTCSVGPGFDFADFAMLSDHPAEAERLGDLHPETKSLL